MPKPPPTSDTGAPEGRRRRKPKAGSWEHVVALQTHIRELETTLNDTNRENIRLRDWARSLNDSHADAQRRIEALAEALRLACADLSGTHEEAKALARAYETAAANNSL